MTRGCGPLAPYRRLSHVDLNPDALLKELTHSPLGFGQAAQSGIVDQLQRPLRVLLHTLPVVVGQPEIEAGKGVTLLGCCLPQRRRAGGVIVDTPPFGVHQRKVGQGLGQAGAGVEFRSAQLVPLHPLPGLVQQRQGVFGLRALIAVAGYQFAPDRHGRGQVSGIHGVKPGLIALRASRYLKQPEAKRNNSRRQQSQTRRTAGSNGGSNRD